jgi:hypothetical protein
MTAPFTQETISTGRKKRFLDARDPCVSVSSASAATQAAMEDEMASKSGKAIKFRAMDADVPVTRTYVETLLRAGACVQPSNTSIQQMADDAERRRVHAWLEANVTVVS